MAALSSTRKSYPILFWRPLWDIAVCYIPIVLAMMAVLKISWWLYPIAAFVVANRLLKLSLLSHEGLHGNLSSNKFWNEWIGRWLCGYPSMLSFSKYRSLHGLHHWAIGSERWDPDRNLYEIYPVTANGYFLGTLKNLFTFRIALRFMDYYVFPEAARRKQLKLFFSGDSDLKGFIALHLIILAAVIYFGCFWNYELLYVFPVTFLLQPYVILMGGLQHGPIREGKQPELVSRSIRGPSWLMEILLPCHIHYHAEHHMNSSVPHYWLPQFSRDLESQGVPVWKENYAEALGALFVESNAKETDSELTMQHG
jgi:fatty acid desaturase